jgi:hypothetical protein
MFSYTQPHRNPSPSSIFNHHHEIIPYTLKSNGKNSKKLRSQPVDWVEPYENPAVLLRSWRILASSGPNQLIDSRVEPYEKPPTGFIFEVGGFSIVLIPHWGHSATLPSGLLGIERQLYHLVQQAVEKPSVCQVGQRSCS